MAAAYGVMISTVLNSAQSRSTCRPTKKTTGYLDSKRMVPRSASELGARGSGDRRGVAAPSSLRQ